MKRPSARRIDCPIEIAAPEGPKEVEMTEKILLVDDETDFLEVMAERMAARGIEVTTATSAQEALQKVEHETFDAVILDLRMPEVDGLEALKIIKARQPESQVILLTGQATVQDGIAAMKLGAMDFLEKPADMSVLLEKIHSAQANKMLVVEQKIEEKMKKIIGGRGW
jgi:DNA-binding NtrC family response regulator